VGRSEASGRRSPDRRRETGVALTHPRKDRRRRWLSGPPSRLLSRRLRDLHAWICPVCDIWGDEEVVVDT
jgi:hypothetical protein